MVECGKKCLSLSRNIFFIMMINFTGEYDCKVDTKGRIMLPIAFRREMGEVEAYRFVIKKDMYEKCLELMTIEEWDRLCDDIQKNTRPYNPNDRKVQRIFREGATEVECDPTGRLLIPGRLMKYAEITNETVLLGIKDKIEIWSPALYNDSCSDLETKSKLVELIMGDVTYKNEQQ